jgi:hypothetical protein
MRCVPCSISWFTTLDEMCIIKDGIVYTLDKCTLDEVVYALDKYTLDEVVYTLDEVVTAHRSCEVLT